MLVILDMVTLEPMDIPMELDTTDTTLARGLLMPSLRPRPTLPSCTPAMDMVCPMLDMLDMVMLDMLDMDMLATHMPGENKLLMS